jgi:DNA-binding SARP family transcriptional activator
VELSLGILGPIEALVEGRGVILGGPRQRALLALLALAPNRAVSVDRLAAEIYGDEAPATADAQVQNAISALRRRLGPAGPAIVTQPPGYLLRVRLGQVDLHRFEALVEHGTAALAAGDAEGAAAALREALAVWRGPALADLADQPFARSAAARLEELRQAAVEARVDADLARGRASELVPELEEVVATHPLRERPRAQLMLALYRSGRQAEALAAFRAARRTLVEEVGLEPGTELRDLEQAILRQDPALLAPRADPAPLRAVLVAATADRPLRALLALAADLGREGRELIALRLVDEGGDLATAARDLAALRSALVGEGVRVRAAAFTSRAPSADLLRLSAAHTAELVLVDAPHDLLEEGVATGDLARLLAAEPADVAVLVARATSTARGPVAVLFGGSTHDWAALETAARLARSGRVPLRLVGTAADPRRGRRDASRLLAAASLAVQALLGLDAEPRLVVPRLPEVLDVVQDARLVVVGLASPHRREVLGSVALALARTARAPVLMLRRGVRPGGLAPPGGLTRFSWSLELAGPGAGPLA